jgi:putative tricarboxylic transport membrane protein
MARWCSPEFASGLLITVLGFAAILAVGDLETGTVSEMGPGYVPRTLAWTILAAGMIMAAAGVLRSRDVLPRIYWRPLLLVSAAAITFGVLIDRFGIVAAVVLCTAVASLASNITRHRETPILCLLLATGAALIFVKGLGLAIPIWPR